MAGNAVEQETQSNNRLCKRGKMHGLSIKPSKSKVETEMLASQKKN